MRTDLERWADMQAEAEREAVAEESALAAAALSEAEEIVALALDAAGFLVTHVDRDGDEEDDATPDAARVAVAALVEAGLLNL